MTNVYHHAYHDHVYYHDYHVYKLDNLYNEIFDTNQQTNRFLSL